MESCSYNALLALVPYTTMENRCTEPLNVLDGFYRAVFVGLGAVWVMKE